MNCRMECPGTYEPKTILFRGKQDGKPVMIEGVPALVCQVCGDTVLEPNVMRHIEALLHSKEQPSKQYPVFTFAQKAA